MKIKNFSIVLLLLLFFLQTNFLYPSSNTAILNIHWGMNPKQVQNATNKELEEEHNSTDNIKIYSNKLRIVDRARLSNIKYYFYKNQLYKIKVTKDLSLQKNRIINQLLIHKGLDQEFDNIIQTLNNGSKYETNKDNQKIVFYLNSNDLNGSDTVFLEMKYEPIANQITNTN